MTENKQEEASFRAALDRASSEVISKRLDDNVIARSWKRDMAEAELTRREAESVSRSTSDAMQTKKRHNSATLKGWLLSIILLICALSGAVVFLMK